MLLVAGWSQIPINAVTVQVTHDHWAGDFPCFFFHLVLDSVPYSFAYLARQTLCRFFLFRTSLPVVQLSLLE
jgi:hypothetical protein